MHFATLEALFFVLTLLSATSGVNARAGGSGDHGVTRKLTKLEARAVPKPESLDSKRRLMGKRSYANEQEGVLATGRTEAVKRNQNSRRKVLQEHTQPKVKRAGNSMVYDPNYGYTTTLTKYATTVSTELVPILTTNVYRGATTVRTIGTSTSRETITTGTSYGVSSSRLPYQTTETFTTTIASGVPTTLYTTSTGTSIGYSTRYTSTRQCDGYFGFFCSTVTDSQLIPTQTAYQTATYATATRTVNSYTTSTGTTTYIYTPTA